MNARSIVASFWGRLGPGFLPFADAATRDLPLGRLLRLSMFQISVGVCLSLLIGTLNRVMIVELGLHAWLVAAMVGLPLLFAPFRALIGHRSDQHRSVFGWRRVPYLWSGTLLQFCGLSFMPFAVLALSGQEHGPAWVGQVGAALSFLLVGAGMQIAQTAGLALATDLASEPTRPRVVALMYVMLLVGMVGSGLAFSVLLQDFTPLRLIQVVQGAAAFTLLINGIALWKQEPRRASAAAEVPPIDFRAAWREFSRHGSARRFLVLVALGTAAFNMQDIILEPYGAEVLHLSVAETSLLTALLAAGSLAAFALAARLLTRGDDPYRIAAYGALAGLVAFTAVILSSPFGAPLLFRVGATLIGFGGGLFAVGTLTAAMGLDEQAGHGLALGAWGAVQATAAGASIALGGALRDGFSALAQQQLLGAALNDAVSGYALVYHLELLLLFFALVAVGPLVRASRRRSARRVGLAQLPG